MLYPIIPTSALNALKIFSITENQIDLSSLENNNYLLANTKINKVDMSNPEALVKYEYSYLKKRSFSFDLLIIFYTIIGKGTGDALKKN